MRIETVLAGVGGSALGAFAGWHSGAWLSTHAGIERSGEDPGIVLGGVAGLAGSTFATGLATTFTSVMGGSSTTLGRQLQFSALGAALGILAYVLTAYPTDDHRIGLVSYSVVQGIVAAVGAARSGR